MSRKNESNQKAALRSAFGQFLRENDVTIKHSDDVNSIMKDMISLVLEGALDEEMDEHLGYLLFRTLNDASFFTLNCAVSV